MAADTPGVAECYNGYPSDHIPVRVRYEIGGSSGGPTVLPGTLQAEDYDLGGAGVAYADRDSGNNGGAYRTDDVDIKMSSEGGFAVGWIMIGEWLAYTVNVPAAGISPRHVPSTSSNGHRGRVLALGDADGVAICDADG